MSEKNGRMDEETEVLLPKETEEVKKPETAEIDDNVELEEIISEDATTGRKKIDLSFLEDENIYFSDEQEEITSETEEKIMEGKKKSFFKRLSKPKKIALSIFIVLLCLIILLVATVAIYVFSKLAKINDGKDIANMSTEYVDPDYEEILFDAGSEGYRQALKDWATTGNKNHMRSDNVINVLLIGADSRNGTNTGNTDVMMLVSLNKTTKKITLCSFLRDSYIYVEGKNRQSYTKLNASFSMGGAECLVNTIENNYKIEIDNYVMVNFESFARIVDAMGGLNLDVTQSESNYCLKKFGEALPVGDNVKLNGRQVVYFCRNRNYDSGDVKRTENQREVIEAIIDKVKSASLTDLDKYIDILLPEIYTGYIESEILSLGVEAITGGWAKYSRTQITAPGTDCRLGGDAGGMWIWVIDYQKAAHDLQVALYGKSNITLESDRVTLIDIYKDGQQQSDNSGDSGNSGGNQETVEDTTAPVTEPETLPGEDIGMEEPPVEDTTSQDIPITEQDPNTGTDTPTEEDNPGEETSEELPPSGGDEPVPETPVVDGGDMQ